jgi:hypothetical protein
MANPMTPPSQGAQEPPKERRDRYARGQFELRQLTLG